MIDKTKLEEIVHTNPLALLTLKDQCDIDIVNNYLPYSTGFEIECNFNDECINREDFNKIFRIIPNIIHVDCDMGEQRFRIPSGINGLLCLYNICNQLKLHSTLNLNSGIHYHIDCTNVFSKVRDYLDQFSEYKEYILKQLDEWQYPGSYNKRRIDTDFSWIRYQSGFQTLEFRIGEMSFDYNVLVRRIIHANKIVKDLKILALKSECIVFQEFNKKEIINYIKNTSINKQILDNLLKENKIVTTTNPNILFKRVIKL